MQVPTEHLHCQLILRKSGQVCIYQTSIWAVRTVQMLDGILNCTISIPYSTKPPKIPRIKGPVLEDKSEWDEWNIWDSAYYWRLKYISAIGMPSMEWAGIVRWDSERRKPRANISSPCFFTLQTALFIDEDQCPSTASHREASRSR
jgi:hypothetical protein